MRVVNLSSRPFLNRRPVRRVALLLWVVGGLLLALNLWLYADYLAGTTKNRVRLAELGAEIDAGERQLDAIGQRLQRIDLGSRNARAAFLNNLIDQRTFPWSRLFDDLEDALSDDVYLSSVAPKVVDETDDKRSSPSVRRLTPREARERARRQRLGQSDEPAMPTAATTNVEESDDLELVEFELRGTARSEEALLDFVDALYENDRFTDPFLSTSQRDEATGGTSFFITCFYLLPRREPAPDTGIDLADASGGADGSAVSAGSPIPNGATNQDGTGGRTGATTPEAMGAGDGVATVPPRTQPQSPSSRLGDASAEAAAEALDSTAARPTSRDRATERGDRARRPSAVTRGTPTGRPAGRLPTGAQGRGEVPTERDPSPEDSPAVPVPELTEPPASGTPALRRIGSLEPPTTPTDAEGPTREART